MDSLQGDGKWEKETYLEASISTRLAGNPSRHLTQCATWPALLRAGNRVLSDTPNAPIDVDPGDGSEIEKIQDDYGLDLCSAANMRGDARISARD